MIRAKTVVRDGSPVDLPLVTVVTPSLNQGEFIEATIRSVVEQQYPRLEYWIVDGGSSDRSREIIRYYAERFDFIRWVSEPDNGQSHAINKGFKKAKGDIVAWLNADDTYRPHAVSNAVKMFAAHPEYKMIYGDAFFIDESGKETGVFPHTEKIFNYKRLVLVSDYISQPTVFFKRDIFTEIGFLDETLNWCMDWDFWIRIASKYPVGYLSCFLANHRDYITTKTRTGGRKRFDEIVRVVRKHSGKRFPPAIAIYGLGTLISRFKAVKWIRKAENLRLFHLVINRYIKKFKYIFPDGWVSREIEFTFFGDKRYFGFTGYVPRQLVPLRFKIRVNDRVIQDGFIRNPGAFTVGVEIPGDILQPERNSIGIRSRRTGILFPGDRRRVSFRLIDYAFEKKTAREQGIPKISIMTPVVRESKLLEAAIRSVAEQNYPKVEHLIIWIGPEKELRQIKKKYGRRFPFLKWHRTEHHGVGRALNLGLAKAGGDIISWLDARDSYEKGAFNVVADFFRMHPHEHFLIENPETSGKKHTPGMSPGPVQKNYFYAHNNFSRSSAFWEKTVNRCTGNFSEHIGTTVDFDFWIRVSDGFRVNPAPRRLMKRSIHCYSDAERNWKMLAEILNVVNNHFQGIGWPWAIRFARAYAKHRLKLKSDSRFGKVVFNAAVIGVAAYKKAIFCRMFRRRYRTGLRT